MATPTNIGVNATMPDAQDRLEPCGTAFGGWVAALTGRAEQTVNDPSEVSDAIVKLVETPNGNRPRRTVVAPATQYEAAEALNRAADSAAAAVMDDMGVAAFAVAR